MIKGSGDDELIGLAAKQKCPVQQQLDVMQTLTAPGQVPPGLPPGFPAQLPGMPPMAPRNNSHLVVTMGLENFESNHEGYNTSILADHIISESNGVSSMVSVEEDAPRHQGCVERFQA